MKNITIVKKAFKATLPVMAGYCVLSIGFGILMASKGYGVLWAGSMSLFVFAGSMQYLAVDLLFDGASLLTAAVTTLMVNFRHVFYGISMVDKYKNAGKMKPYLIFALTDEVYSLGCGELPDGIENPSLYYLCVSAFSQSYWVMGTLLGSLLGSFIPLDVKGIDFSLTALFITVVIDQWKSTKNHFSVLLGIAVSLICLVIFGPDKFLIPSMLAVLVVLILAEKKEGKI